MRKFLKFGVQVGKIDFKFKSHPAKKSYKSKFSAELAIEVPKRSMVVVKEAGKDLYQTISAVSDKAAREVRKLKEKRLSFTKRGLNKVKTWLKR